MDLPPSALNGGPASTALSAVRAQIMEAVAASKCHKCGCLHQTLEALAKTGAGRAGLASTLAQAQAVLADQQYDCLGCAECFPATAANVFAEAFPDESGALDLCPTEAPQPRTGWPPLPGEYSVVRYQAPVAVCALGTQPLVRSLAELAPEGLSVVGTMHTENLGIERVIKNVLANPHIRFLILCGQDTQQAVGHLPGQTLESLFANGIDDKGRIPGAQGKRPILQNVTREDVDAFRRQVELVSMIGQLDAANVASAVRACAGRSPGASTEPRRQFVVDTLHAQEPPRLVPDPAGFLVVYPDVTRTLVVEHYTNAGVLTAVVEGSTPSAVCSAVLERGLITRLDHAAYLGRELARAEHCVQAGTPYVQDRAPGELEPGGPATCGCTSGCGKA